MTDRELMQQALDALELLARYENPATKIQVRKPRDGGSIVTMYPHKVASEAATALRAAIEQAQEPVCDKDPQGCWSVRCQLGKICKHTAPRQWKGLTDQEIWSDGSTMDLSEDGIRNFARAIEAKLKTKNT